MLISRTSVCFNCTQLKGMSAPPTILETSLAQTFQLNEIGYRGKALCFDRLLCVVNINKFCFGAKKHIAVGVYFYKKWQVMLKQAFMKRFWWLLGVF
jgi:hypothetical protein